MRKILIVAIAFCFAFPAFAQKTKSVLSSEITSQFPNNNTGAITPQILRTVTGDFVSSWQQFPAVNPQTGVLYTFQASDYGALVTFSNVAPIAASLPTPSGSFGIGYNIYVRNLNSGVVTITPSGATINGAATLTVSQNQSVWIVSDGNNYQVWNNSSGTVTSIALTETGGGIFTVSGSPITSSGTFTLGLSGTSGGIPFFNSRTTQDTTALLAANGVVYGGGAGAAPAATAAGASGTILANPTGGSPPSFSAQPTIGNATNNGRIGFQNTTGGVTTLSPTGNTASNFTLTMPSATDTLIGKATTDTLTNKTYDTADAGNVFKINTQQISATSGTGNTVPTTVSPVFTTPNIGAATATSVNKMAITAPASSSTLAVADGKTLTVNSTLTLTGTDSTTMTFPTSSASVAALNLASQTLSGGVTVTQLTQSTGSIGLNCGSRALQSILNNGAFTITAPSNDGTCILQVINQGSAGAISFSGFQVGSNTGDTLTTVNGYKFFITVVRISGNSTYSVKALQ